MDISRLIVYLLITLLGIGFFAGVEIAFVAAHRINLELKRKQGTFAGRILGRFLDRPQELTSTALVGLYLALVAYGLLMTRATDVLLNGLPAPLDNVWVRLVLDTAVAAFVIMIFSALLPKSLFRNRAAAVLSFLSLPILLAYHLMHPVAQLLTSLAEGMLKYLFGVRVNPERPVFTRVDVETFTKTSLQGHDSDTPAMNTELFENALDLVNVKVRRCMVPRAEIIAIEQSASIADVRKKFVETKLSRLPVYESTIDNIVGYVHHLDVAQPGVSQLGAVLNNITAVPEAMSAVDLMSRFNKERKSIAWVVDEFGGTAGIVSMEDVLEKIFGQIRDEHDADEYVEQQIAEGEYLFSGRLELAYLNEKYDLSFPTDAAETLSGYIIASQGHIPRMKERVIVDRYEFDVLLVSATRVESVKMRVLK